MISAVESTPSKIVIDRSRFDLYLTSLSVKQKPSVRAVEREDEIGEFKNDDDHVSRSAEERSAVSRSSDPRVFPHSITDPNATIPPSKSIINSSSSSQVVPVSRKQRIPTTANPLRADDTLILKKENENSSDRIKSSSKLSKRKLMTPVVQPGIISSRIPNNTPIRQSSTKSYISVANNRMKENVQSTIPKDVVANTNTILYYTPEQPHHPYQNTTLNSSHSIIHSFSDNSSLNSIPSVKEIVWSIEETLSKAHTPS